MSTFSVVVTRDVSESNCSPHTVVRRASTAVFRRVLGGDSTTTFQVSTPPGPTTVTRVVPTPEPSSETWVAETLASTMAASTA
jgi:hypothetical protein